LGENALDPEAGFAKLVPLNVRIAQPNMSRLFVLLRYAGAAVLAGALVFFGAGLLVHHFAGRHSGQTVGLTVIRGIQLITKVPGQASSANPDTAKEQTIKGFVQIGFTVGPDGKAHHIHVIEAQPPGLNEEAAREIIASRRFKPVPAGSKQSGVERSEVVHFQVPTSLLKGSGKGGGSG